MPSEGQHSESGQFDSATNTTDDARLKAENAIKKQRVAEAMVCQEALLAMQVGFLSVLCLG